MTTRRLPVPADQFISGPAANLLRKLPPSILVLLQQLQAAAEADAHSFARDTRQKLSDGSFVWIAGGTIRAALTGTLPTDVDFFFSGSTALGAALSWLKLNYDHIPVASNPVVTKLTLVPSETWQPWSARTNANVDLVKRSYSTPLDTARAMDFVCCSAALSTVTFARHKDFEQDTRNRVLRINAPWAPRSSLRRIERFLDRGWTITPEEQARIQQLADDPKLPDWDFTNSSGLPDGTFDYSDR